MSGRGGKLAVGLLALAVVGGVAFGVHANARSADAGEPQAAPKQPVASQPAAGEPAAGEPVAGKPVAGEPVAVPESSAAPEPAAPPELRDDPPAAPKPPAPAGLKPPVKVTMPTAPKATGPCAEVGPSQLIVEKYLAAHTEYGKVKVDGKQSAADCATIAKFQARFGIQPAHGYAGPVTGKVATRLGAAALGSCNPKDHLAVCIDLTSQTMWVLKDGVRILGPTVVRTGRAGLTTPAGHWRVQNKKRDTISTEFPGVHLPYWQRIVGAMGFHETPSYIYEADSPGSHGCVNLLRRDAAALFDITKVGTEVHIFGRKPGT